MSWAAIVVGVAGTAVSAGMQAKAQKDAKAMQQQAMGAAGRIPDISEYGEVDLRPIDFRQVQNDTINNNYDMMGTISRLLGLQNQETRRQSLTRADYLSPDLYPNMQKTAGLAGKYLQGQIPLSDSTEAVARSTGLNGSIGTPGTGAALTARDLGLMDMDVRAKGAALASNALSQGESLDPRSNYMNPQDLMLTPSQTVPWKMEENLKLSSLALQQAETVYTAEQNGFNIAAGMDPRAMAGLAGQANANKGVDWGQLISGLGSTYQQYQNRNGGLNTGGTYRTSAQVNAAAPYNAGVTKTSGGYVPKAQVVA